jgi:peptidoglycan/LPS O-acetylase OafA/YrhL
MPENVEAGHAMSNRSTMAFAPSMHGASIMRLVRPSAIDERPAKALLAEHAHVRGLDELRGLSVLWVMLSHGTGLTTWMPTAFAGYGLHGVVLFFLISGYLITRILVESKDRIDYFGHFYTNRLFRIWPLMLLALLVSVVIWPVHAPSAVYNLLLVNNYAYAMGIEPPVRTDVMWSLAIEQQFYLFWPVAVWLLSEKALLLITSFIVLIGLGVDGGLLPHGGVKIVHASTLGSMQYLGMGALVAFGREGLKYLLGTWSLFLAWWLTQAAMPVSEFRWIWYGLTFALALLVYRTIHGKPLFQSRYLAFTGERCYGLYLIHFFVSALAFIGIGKGVWMAGTAYFILSFLLAVISFRYFERPIRGLRVYFHENARWRVGLFAGVGFMFLVNVAYLVVKSRM